VQPILANPAPSSSLIPGGVAHAVEHLLCELEALSSDSIPTKRKKKANISNVHALRAKSGGGGSTPSALSVGTESQPGAITASAAELGGNTELKPGDARGSRSSVHSNRP
jgi:hypothetical protein